MEAVSTQNILLASISYLEYIKMMVICPWQIQESVVRVLLELLHILSLFVISPLVKWVRRPHSLSQRCLAVLSLHLLARVHFDGLHFN